MRLNVDKQQNGPLELYDLAGDEGETHNVAEDHPDVVAQLAELMRRGHR